MISTKHSPFNIIISPHKNPHKHSLDPHNLFPPSSLVILFHSLQALPLVLNF